MSAMDDAVRALVAERFGEPVREWHGNYGVPTDYAEVVRRRAELVEVAENEEEGTN